MDKTGKMDPVVHFELPYDDGERMAAFYEAAFGWRTEALGDEMGNYILATTIETGEQGPVRPGAINGGFFPDFDTFSPPGPANFPVLLPCVPQFGL